MIRANVAEAKPHMHKLNIDVPWSFEKQSILLSWNSSGSNSSAWRSDVNGDLSLDGCDVNIGFTYGGITETGHLTLTSVTSDTVNGVQNVLDSFSNVGKVFVSSGPASSTAPVNSANITVTFKSNGGSLPLITVVAADGSCVSSEVSRIFMGSLVNEVQEIKVTSQHLNVTGEFALLSPLYRAADRQYLVESAFIGINATAEEFKNALTHVEIRHHLGLVGVSKSDVSTSSGDYTWSWSVTYLTHGGDIPPLIVPPLEDILTVIILDLTTVQSTVYLSTHPSSV